MADDATEGTEPNAAGANWLLSMADLVSILVCFFVLLFSMTNIERNKWQCLVDSLAAREPTVVDQSGAEAAAPTPAVARIETVPAVDLGYLGNVLAGKLAADPVLKEALMARTEDGLAIALPSELLFPSGRAEAGPGARAALERVGAVLKALGNAIEVRGYTDPDPVLGGEFSSNWTLSLARAKTVASALAEAGYARPILALGQADGRYDDLSPELATPERMRLARRVDIVIRPTATEMAP
jgi:chemotaxis protein MotB